MTGRIRMTAGLLGCIVAAVLAAQWLVLYRCAALRQSAEKAAYILQTGGYAQVAGQLTGLAEQWARDSRLLHMVLPHTMLEDLDEAVARMPGLAREQSGELAAELDAVLAELDWIRMQETTVF
jgi:hypothetical protein